ncbi:hypothetical protein BKA56DRAFT_143943 [Ilyonectria sp. MPI-CAGE-AT-0026]|nr:hypothetical protein BKA56DRAFT_143943 [Ilyonectria sp. MPI-CAGE-AT-0026]
MSEPEEENREIKPDPDSYSDHSSPLSYHGSGESSGDDSDNSCNVKSSPPPSHQPPTSSASFGSPFGYMSRSESRADSHFELSDDLGTEENCSMPSPKILPSSRSMSTCGLKSILKAPKTWPCQPRQWKNGRGNPFSSISGSPLAEHAVSSPSERIQHTKKQAKSIRASASKKVALVPGKKFTTALKRLASNVKKSKPKAMGTFDAFWSPRRKLSAKTIHSTPANRGWIYKKNSLTPLKSVPRDTNSDEADETDGESSSMDMDTPSKVRIKVDPTVPDPKEQTKPTKVTKGRNSPGEQHNWNLVNKSGFDVREFKPAVIRDGVSEHAIKPTIARLEKKIASGEVFANQGQDSVSRYKWTTD